MTMQIPWACLCHTWELVLGARLLAVGLGGRQEKDEEKKRVGRLASHASTWSCCMNDICSTKPSHASLMIQWCERKAEGIG
ncbi:hypothetical protein BD289DRAFT_441040 [Coniella lustricola]|uniref:Secreted protein n=1 Tax=Coniella lustricola TaxID=2025994 RepID=A0A2T2ZZX3_9PEZI|nr:hypothetical protein BD289DRAFT_441040 [Coniella lustricola]